MLVFKKCVWVAERSVGWAGRERAGVRNIINSLILKMIIFCSIAPIRIEYQY